jgi:hypothetical protein
MRGAIPPLSQYAFMAWCLVKHRDNFTFICWPHVYMRFGRYKVNLGDVAIPGFKLVNAAISKGGTLH